MILRWPPGPQGPSRFLRSLARRRCHFCTDELGFGRHFVELRDNPNPLGRSVGHLDCVGHVLRQPRIRRTRELFTRMWR